MFPGPVQDVLKAVEVADAGAFAVEVMVDEHVSTLAAESHQVVRVVVREVTVDVVDDFCSAEGPAKQLGNNSAVNVRLPSPGGAAMRIHCCWVLPVKGAW